MDRGNIGGVLYALPIIPTFIYLTWFDGYVYTWFNWIIALPVNMFLAIFWPGYWLILHWIA